MNTSYKKICFLLFSVSCLFFHTGFSSSETMRHFPAGTRQIFILHRPNIRTKLLKNIAPLVERSIAKGHYPGAVILVAHHGHIIYKGVFGNRRIIPTIAAMHFDTIFDLASLTKVLVTTTAIMQLLEQGKITLDAPVMQYWSRFATNGKEKITLRELLTHTSGLQPIISLPINPQLTITEKQAAAFHAIEALKPEYKPGTHFQYSDLNFITLAHLVDIITGERIDQYAINHIFKPLGLQNTFFLPPKRFYNRIAPTKLFDTLLRWGEVEDPIAYAMGGVAGHAGLFSDAHDLAIYAQCLLNEGRISGSTHGKKTYLLSPLTIVKMSSPQTPANMSDIHGLGWDIDSEFSSNRGVLFPIQSFGHTGWTGTSIWIDPTTQTWLIILTSRAHPTLAPGKNYLIQDRCMIANIVAASILDPIHNLSNTGRGELDRAYANE